MLYTFDFFKTYVLFFCRGNVLVVWLCLSWGWNSTFPDFKRCVQNLDTFDQLPWARSIQPKFSGNFGPKLNGSVWSNRKSFKKTGPPFEVDHFSQSDWSKFGLNGSRPLTCDIFSLGRSANNALMIMIWETQPKVVGEGSVSEWVVVHHSREVCGAHK